MRASLALTVGLSFFAACAEDSVPLDGGGSGDSGVRPDAAADTGVDSGLRDTGFDGGSDAAADGGLDANDGGFDAGFDAGDPSDAAGPVDAGPCADKDDCAPTGWCRETQSGGMACTPWAAEGEFCGGFTAPWAVSRCDPSGGATCNTVVFIPDAPGICSLVATVAQLIGAPANYDGRVVVLDNIFPIAGPATCTPAVPCSVAGACSVDLYIGDTAGATDVVALRQATGLGPITCAGNECDYLDNCPQPIGMNAIVAGIFRAATLSIDVQHFNPSF